MLLEALKCILEKKEKYNLVDNYAIFGSSAGGHLAGMFARDDIGYKKYNLPKPNAAVLVYPVVTLYPLHMKEQKDIFSARIIMKR
jgi:acetyl esterase/lipase